MAELTKRTSGMTWKQAKEADAVALTFEAHRLLGHNIERYEAGHHADEYTNWRFTFSDGSEWGRAYVDADDPCDSVLDRLNADNFGRDDAMELFEHPDWPRHWMLIAWRLDENSQGRVYAVCDAERRESDQHVGDIFSADKSLSLAITRAFVLAHTAEMAKGEVR